MTRSSTGALTFLVMLVASCASSQESTGRVAVGKSLLHELVARQAWSAAFALARRLNQRDPRDPEVLALRGVIYRERRLVVEAESDLLEALRLNPKLAEAHAALAVLYDELGRGDEAEPHHRRAVELEPSRPDYLNNLGFSLWSRGRFEEAIRAYQRALRLSPADRRVHNNLGFAFARRGDLNAAAEQFALAGTAAEARNNMGLVMEQLGKPEEAMAYYRGALAVDPTLLLARENLNRVARLLEAESPLVAPVRGEAP